MFIQRYIIKIKKYVLLLIDILLHFHDVFMYSYLQYPSYTYNDCNAIQLSYRMRSTTQFISLSK